MEVVYVTYPLIVPVLASGSPRSIRRCLRLIVTSSACTKSTKLTGDTEGSVPERRQTTLAIPLKPTSPTPTTSAYTGASSSTTLDEGRGKRITGSRTLGLTKSSPVRSLITAEIEGLLPEPG